MEGTKKEGHAGHCFQSGPGVGGAGRVALIGEENGYGRLGQPRFRNTEAAGVCVGRSDLGVGYRASGMGLWAVWLPDHSLRCHVFGPSQLLRSVTALLQGPLKGSVWDPGSARQTLHVLGVFLLTLRGLETPLRSRETGLASVWRMGGDGQRGLQSAGRNRPHSVKGGAFTCLNWRFLGCFSVYAAP